MIETDYKPTRIAIEVDDGMRHIAAIRRPTKSVTLAVGTVVPMVFFWFFGAQNLKERLTGWMERQLEGETRGKWWKAEGAPMKTVKFYEEILPELGLPVDEWKAAHAAYIAENG